MQLTMRYWDPQRKIWVTERSDMYVLKIKAWLQNNQVSVRVNITLSLQLQMITLTETLIILESQKLNLIIVLLYIEWKKMEVMFLFFTNGKKSCAMVTRDMITHDLECSWHGNRVLWPYMTWLLVTLSVLDMTIE